jgi:hypothetical protein
MTGLEWLARYLPSPLINALRAYLGRPRPDVRILEVKTTGGSHDHVSFSAYVQNYGTQPARATVSAKVRGHEVPCRPTVLDLLVNAPPDRVAITVPRPGLGDLVKDLNNATTLYGAELVVEVVAGKQRPVETWREEMYDPETDRARHEVQQRAWRFSRGEDTEQDRRAEWLAEMPERIRRRRERQDRYDY